MLHCICKKKICEKILISKQTFFCGITNSIQVYDGIVFWNRRYDLISCFYMGQTTSFIITDNPIRWSVSYVDEKMP
jgi:hypothetical protein